MKTPCMMRGQRTEHHILALTSTCQVVIVKPHIVKPHTHILVSTSAALTALSERSCTDECMTASGIFNHFLIIITIKIICNTFDFILWSLSAEVSVTSLTNIVKFQIHLSLIAIEPVSGNWQVIARNGSVCSLCLNKTSISDWFISSIHVYIILQFQTLTSTSSVRKQQIWANPTWNRFVQNGFQHTQKYIKERWCASRWRVTDSSCLTEILEWNYRLIMACFSQLQYNFHFFNT